MIPKILHYVWVGDPMPDKYKRCVDQWHTALPDYEIRAWTNDNVPQTPYVQTAFVAKKWINAADYLRVWVVAQEGGIYLDADTEILKPFDDLLQYDFFVGTFSGGNKFQFAANAVIGAPVNDPIAAGMLGAMNVFLNGDEPVFEFSGPPLITAIVKRKLGIEAAPAEILTQRGVTGFPPEFFFPPNGEITDRTYIRHHGFKMW